MTDEGGHWEQVAPSAGSGTNVKVFLKNGTLIRRTYVVGAAGEKVERWVEDR